MTSLAGAVQINESGPGGAVLAGGVVDIVDEPLGGGVVVPEELLLPPPQATENAKMLSRQRAKNIGRFIRVPPGITQGDNMPIRAKTTLTLACASHNATFASQTGSDVRDGKHTDNP